MQNLDTIAKELVRKIETSLYDDGLRLAKEALKGAYELGKKHLIEPSHLMDADNKPVKETDTFNPIH